eukprot:gb/GEZN01004003.1/.p1 GENE.gb/GEZN01004003.1/~~gb/GEZN01004003.1/.p1  ORF type:complete len:560 (+),score=60.31 gb/GEZN01004003.1/:242-1921(+)
MPVRKRQRRSLSQESGNMDIHKTGSATVEPLDAAESPSAKWEESTRKKRAASPPISVPSSRPTTPSCECGLPRMDGATESVSADEHIEEEETTCGNLLMLGTRRPAYVMRNIDVSTAATTEIKLSHRRGRGGELNEVTVTLEVDPSRPNELQMSSELTNSDMDCRMNERLLDVQNEIQRRQEELKAMEPELQDLTLQLADCEEDDVQALQEEFTRQARVAGLHRRRVQELSGQTELSLNYQVTTTVQQVTLISGVPQLTPWLPHPLVFVAPIASGKMGTPTSVTTVKKMTTNVPLEVQGNFEAQLSVQSGLALASSPDGTKMYAVDRLNQRLNAYSTKDCALLHSWPVLGEVFGLTASATHIYATGGEQCVRVYDLQGNVVQAWGSHGSGDKEFNSPTGLAVSETAIYISDSLNRRVQVYDLQGNFVKSWHVPNLFKYPFGIAVANSLVFVTDCVLNCVKVFDMDGTQKRSWGVHGTGEGQFDQPSGVMVNGPFVYVADSRNHRVQVFDQQGRFIRSWLHRAPLAGGSWKHFRPLGITVCDRSAFVSAMDAEDGIHVFK